MPGAEPAPRLVGNFYAPIRTEQSDMGGQGIKNGLMKRLI